MIRYENKTPKDIIMRPLSSFHVQYVDYKSQFGDSYKIGAEFCHGNNHYNDVISKLKFIKNWYSIDVDRSAYPDYIGNVSNVHEMNYFPDEYFDCVLTEYCGLTEHDIDATFIHLFEQALKIFHRIIKKDGTVCLTELPSMSYYIMDNDEFNYVVNKVNDIVPKEKLLAQRDVLIKYGILNEKSNPTDFYVWILANYHLYPETTDLLDKLSLRYTKRFLKKNNFKFIGMKLFEFMNTESKILFAIPINK